MHLTDEEFNDVISRMESIAKTNTTGVSAVLAIDSIRCDPHSLVQHVMSLNDR